MLLKSDVYGGGKDVHEAVKHFMSCGDSPKKPLDNLLFFFVILQAFTMDSLHVFECVL